VVSDAINVSVSDGGAITASEYGFSPDSTCNASDTYGNAFSSGVNFTIVGDHIDYLCIKATDDALNTSYQLVGQLNTDNTAPIITSFIVPTTLSSLTIPISTFTVSGSATNYCLTEVNSSAGCSWSGTVQTEYIFATEGSKTLYAWTKDAAGNISDSSSDSVVIALSTTDNAPTPPSSSGGGSRGGSSSGRVNTPLSTTPISQTYSFTRNLSRGSEGTDVIELQKFLVTQNYLTTDNVTGYFGPVTEKALQNFQKVNNIISSGTPATTGFGNFGALTRNKINTILPASSNLTQSVATSTKSIRDLIFSLQKQLIILLAQLVEMLRK
jgi:hypothetical protein